jgi:hypothetical protein
MPVTGAFPVLDACSGDVPQKRNKGARAYLEMWLGFITASSLPRPWLSFVPAWLSP